MLHKEAKLPTRRNKYLGYKDELFRNAVLITKMWYFKIKMAITKERYFTHLGTEEYKVTLAQGGIQYTN